jgi:hypothetical protein
MASRKELKALAREQRLAAEAKKLESQMRMKRLRIWFAGVAVVVSIVVGGAVLIVNGRADRPSAAADRSPASTSAGLPGIQETVPPWAPETAQLDARLEALQIPTSGDDPVHFHSLLTVYVDGEKVEVPPDIGIVEETSTMAPIHSHDDSGLIHVEAPQKYPFKLSDIFAVWGVRFDAETIGGYVAVNGSKISVFVDGKPATQSSMLLLKDQANIVVAYGATDSIDKLPDDGALGTA